VQARISDLRLVPGDDGAIRIAKAVALTAGVREGVEPAHAARVAELAAATAGEDQQPVRVIACCRIAGWLHDIGMVAMPDEVLAQRSRPDPPSAPLRTHPLIGAQLVARVPELAQAAVAIRHHHEQYDGNGYPDALTGDEIPVAARILACADHAAALVPSRQAPSRVRAAGVEQLRRLAGSVLDPHYTRLVIRVVTHEAAGADDAERRTA
jgi:HD-GYP domain-containing protein (c-di-GMP phosphodiesterase class II)